VDTKIHIKITNVMVCICKMALTISMILKEDNKIL